MTARFFSGKSNVSYAIPLAMALLALAAPVEGQEPDAAQDARAQDTEAMVASEAPPATQAKVPLEVTADRVRQPLVVPSTETRLARINLGDMQPWNWNGTWHASEWANGDSTIPWKYGRVRQAFGGDTHFVLNASGAPELKGQRAHPELRNGLYEVDVTIPTMRPGLIATPIMLFSDKTQESIAVQVVGQRKLQFTIHGAEEGVRKTENFTLAGDYSGRRMRIAIRRHADLGLIDLFIDGELAHSFTEASPALPNSAMQPVISLYAGDKHGWSKQWAGEWQPLASGEQIRMTVHGYRVTAL